MTLKVNSTIFLEDESPILSLQYLIFENSQTHFKISLNIASDHSRTLRIKGLQGHILQ